MTLDHLCNMHNILQDQLVSAERERQEAIVGATMYELGVFEAVKQLRILRDQLNDCFQAAYKKVSKELASSTQQAHPPPCNIKTFFKHITLI
jgi:hypothetical protein